MTRQAFLLFLLTQTATPVPLHPIVQTSNGVIEGRVEKTVAGTNFLTFEGVPYGEPPVGNLRFLAPQPVDSWDGILNATYSDLICYQFTPTDGTQTEDCLRLNVFKPTGTDELLPVMVYIYGGGFVGGTTRNSPPDLFVDNGVILVTINYRTGVFGFISTQDDVIPGNGGLKDQLLALQWIHDNIESFGGDPAKVTVFGQSAGGGSSAYLLLNQNANHLVSGAILESGTFLSSGMFQRDPRPKAFGTAAILNSTFKTSDDSEGLLEFLQSLDADVLNEAAIEYVGSITNSWDDFIQSGSKFSPVIEAKNPSAFLTKKQYSLLKAGNVLPVPTMIGFTSLEKIGSYQDQDAFKDLVAIIDDNLGYIVPDDMGITDDDERSEMGAKIRDIYTDGAPFSDNLAAAVRYASDNFLSRPTIKHAELFSSIAPTFLYQFSFDGDLDHANVHYDDAGGVGHSSELKYLFCSGIACSDSSLSEADLLTRARMGELWTNFAKFQNPTPESAELLQGVTWPQVDIQDGDLLYLDIGADLEVKNHPKQDAYSRWVELYDGLNYDDFDTY